MFVHRLLPYFGYCAVTAAMTNAFDFAGLDAGVFEWSVIHQEDPRD